MMKRKPKEGIFCFVRLFLLLQILPVAFAAVEVVLSAEDIWNEIQYKGKDASTKFCSIERAANSLLAIYTSGSNQFILKFADDQSQYCIIADEKSDDEMRDCLNEKLNLFRDNYYDDNTGANGFTCDWNPREAVGVDIQAVSGVPIILTRDELEERIIKQGSNALTTYTYYYDRYEYILFEGFDLEKFVEKLNLKDEISADELVPRCCPASDGCDFSCSVALNAAVDYLCEELGCKSLAEEAVVVLNEIDEQGEEVLVSENVLAELSNALLEETLAGRDADFEDETNQDNVIAAIEEQLLLQQQANGGEGLFVTASESVTVTMDLCLEEKDKLSAGIPLNPNYTVEARPDVFSKELNNSVTVTVDNELKLLNVNLANVNEKWKKTTLKLFLLYVNEVGGDGRKDTALVKLTKKDCDAAEEKAEQTLAQRQDLRNVNFPIVHSKIFYFPDELADIERSFGAEEVQKIRDQSKKLQQFFIETSVAGYDRGFNGFRINSIEYVGIRRANPEFTEKSFTRKYGTGQISDFVITLYADNKNTTNFKEVFKKITEIFTTQINGFIDKEDIKYISEEDKIVKRVLQMNNEKTPRSSLRSVKREFIVTPLEFSEPMEKEDFFGVTVAFIVFMLLVNFLCVLSVYHTLTVKTILWKVIRTLIVGLKSYTNYNKVNLAISYATSEGLMYRPDPVVRTYLFLNPFLGMLLVGFSLAISLKFDAKGAPFAAVFPLTMCVFICNCLALDLPHIFVTYFYMTRYKPPSLDIRIAAIIDVALTVILALFLLYSQATSFKHFTDKAGSDRLGADKRRFRRRLLQASIVAMVPFLVILPTVKIICTIQTIVNTVVGKIELTAYDPKSTAINGILDNGEMDLGYRDNQYGEIKSKLTAVEQYFKNNFNTAAFKQRTKDCVISRIGKYMKTESIPNPLAEGCVNTMEITFIVFTILGLLMMLSFLIFLKFSWPYILEALQTENFIPVLCGERRGNKRTVATNVRAEDIEALNEQLKEGSFWTRLLWKITAPPTEEEIEKKNRRYQEKLDAVQRVKDSEANFWKNFILMKDEPTLKIKPDLKDKAQNLCQKIFCCKSNKVENNVRADGVETRETGSGPDPAIVSQPTTSNTTNYRQLPSIAKRRFDVKRQLRQSKRAIPKEDFEKMSTRKQESAYRRAEVNVIGYETRHELKRWTADDHHDPTLAAIRLEDEPELELKEAGKLAPIMIQTIPIEHKNAVSALVVDISATSGQYQ